MNLCFKLFWTFAKIGACAPVRRRRAGDPDIFHLRRGVVNTPRLRGSGRAPHCGAPVHTYGKWEV